MTMKAPWYDTITGGHLWPVVLKSVRHFSSIEPTIPGVSALCGEVASQVDEEDVSRTCEQCSAAAAGIRVVLKSAPEPEAVPQDEPLDPMEFFLQLSTDEQAAVIEVVKALAGGQITSKDLVR